MGIEPERFKKLPFDHRGFRVPKFVAEVDGKYDFRVIKPGWPNLCYSKDLCWLCGEKLGKFKCFVIGPMCAINRVSAEPPSHLECARYAVQVCPFMLFPNRKRDETNMPEQAFVPAGVMIKRNPGVACLWVVTQYFPRRVGDGLLLDIGNPTSVEWWAHGRKATRDEVDRSIAGGLPTLKAMAFAESMDAVDALNKQIIAAQKYLPEAA